MSTSEADAAYEAARAEEKRACESFMLNVAQIAQLANPALAPEQRQTMVADFTASIAAAQRRHILSVHMNERARSHRNRMHARVMTKEMMARARENRDLCRAVDGLRLKKEEEEE